MFVCFKHYRLYLWFNLSSRNWILKPYPLHNYLAALIKLYRKLLKIWEQIIVHGIYHGNVRCHYFTRMTVGTFTITDRRLCSFENGFSCSYFQFLKLKTKTFCIFGWWFRALLEHGRRCILYDNTRVSAHTTDVFDFLNFLSLYRTHTCKQTHNTVLKQEDHKQLIPIYWVSQQQHRKFCCTTN